jgi:DNA-binding transcriptional ArsR family regulator
MPLEDAEPDQSSASSRMELRKITDARTMRALAHPVRIALVEELALGGAMTATEVGERIGESPTTCSFHLRQLAKYGWVEEAGGGKGRARPWRISAIGFSLASSHDDPETDIAASTLTNLFVERQLNRYRVWQETKATYPRPWRDAATSSEFLFYLTADELDQFTDEMHELLMSKFPQERLIDPSKRPPGSVPVELLLFAYPMKLPAPSGAPASDAPADKRTDDEGAGG